MIPSFIKIEFFAIHSKYRGSPTNGLMIVEVHFHCQYYNEQTSRNSILLFYFNSLNIFCNSNFLNVASYLLSDTINFNKNLSPYTWNWFQVKNFCEIKKYTINQNVFCNCSLHLPYYKMLYNKRISIIEWKISSILIKLWSSCLIAWGRAYKSWIRNGYSNL